MNYSENAVFAKVHALFAKCLTNKDYENLLSFHSNDEIFNYLCNETAYCEYLDILPSVTLSPTRFENVLRKSLLQRNASLCRFQKLIGDKTYRYFIKKDEIDTILYYARRLDTFIINDLPERPAIFANEQVISGPELQKASSFEEFAQTLAQTPYGKLTEPFFSQGQGYKNLAVLERALYNNLYSDFKSTVDKKYKGKRRKEILNYINFSTDMIFISSIYRLLENFPEYKNYTAGLLTPSVTAFTKKELSLIENADSPEDILNVIKGSVYRKHFNGKIDNIDLFVRNLLINESIKNIRYSQNPVLVLLSYETVLKNEIQNITHIIEGIKYGLSPDEISHLIVKGGC